MLQYIQVGKALVADLRIVIISSVRRGTFVLSFSLATFRSRPFSLKRGGGGGGGHLGNLASNRQDEGIIGVFFSGSYCFMLLIIMFYELFVLYFNRTEFLGYKVIYLKMIE